MFDEDFLRNLPDDHVKTLEKLCEKFFESPIIKNFSEENYDEYVKAYGVLFPMATDIVPNLTEISFGPNKRDNFNLIHNFFKNVNSFVIQYNTNKLVKETQNDFQAIRGKNFYYEFKEDDFSKIQDYINKLRTLISETTQLSENHKIRLLKRLEKVQMELHKRVSDVDRFLGLLLDINIVVKDLGENAKPFVSLTKNISKIITNLILVQNGLPPSELPHLLDK